MHSCCSWAERSSTSGEVEISKADALRDLLLSFYQESVNEAAIAVRLRLQLLHSPTCFHGNWIFHCTNEEHSLWLFWRLFQLPSSFCQCYTALSQPVSALPGDDTPLIPLSCGVRFVRLSSNQPASGISKHTDESLQKFLMLRFRP